MTQENTSTQQSRLIGVLREGITIVQMILFKEVRDRLGNNHPDLDTAILSKLAGTITNEVFGTSNPDEKFRLFRRENSGLIEQELLGLHEQLPKLRGILSDALRVQALCDTQEGNDASRLLTRADELGLLIPERDIPLPSIFMTRIRTIGAEYNLIVPPIQIDTETDQLLH